MHHCCMKHVDTRYHFIRDCVEGRKVKIEYVNTEPQLADLLKKSLRNVNLLKRVRRLAWRL